MALSYARYPRKCRTKSNAGTERIYRSAERLVSVLVPWGHCTVRAAKKKRPVLRGRVERRSTRSGRGADTSQQPREACDVLRV